MSRIVTNDIKQSSTTNKVTDRSKMGEVTFDDQTLHEISRLDNENDDKMHELLNETFDIKQNQSKIESTLESQNQYTLKKKKIKSRHGDRRKNQS